MTKKFNEFIDDVEELKFGDRVALITAIGAVHNLVVESAEGETIEFSDGSEHSKEKLQKHVDDFEDDKDRGIKYKGNKYS